MTGSHGRVDRELDHPGTEIRCDHLFRAQDPVGSITRA